MFTLSLADPSTSLRAPASYTLISAGWIQESDDGVAAAADPGRHRALQERPCKLNRYTRTGQPDASGGCPISSTEISGSFKSRRTL